MSPRTTASVLPPGRPDRPSIAKTKPRVQDVPASRARYLSTVLREARSRHGVVERALAEALGVGKSQARRLCDEHEPHHNLTAAQLVALCEHPDPRVCAVGLDVAAVLVDLTLGAELVSGRDVAAQVRELDTLGLAARDAGRDVVACPTPPALRTYARRCRALSRAAAGDAAWAEAAGRDEG